ncbi:uncharacterized mitochondrial protein AtMg00860-like [Impatiens glandulifera]|uniref:uncharacterized mitochondrial protein AtMg00860-like n=1 Tax=Impatiens glandulifera TaxID=253017 RepID=UPI001FB0D86A|nr:uncharacterized mitochondrial protein AtMg00860-like [Impatiens glandulifera]
MGDMLVCPRSSDVSWHRVKSGCIMMDEVKVKAIQEWEAPKTVPQLRSFLSLVNYYRKFITGYSKIAAPLTDLLKKDRSWRWDEKCLEAFEGLKAKVTKQPVLALPDHAKENEVQTDASDFSIGGVDARGASYCIQKPEVKRYGAAIHGP